MDGTAGTEHVPSRQATVAEAAAILGVSVVTIRRMIKRGELEAERVVRPQGSAYLVTLPPDAPSPSEDGTPTEQSAQDVSRTDGTPVGLMAAWSEAFLAPLVAELAESRQTVERQAERLVELARENGILTERLAGLERVRDAAVAHAQELEERLAERPTEPAPDPEPAPEVSTMVDTPPWWRRLLLAVYG